MKRDNFTVADLQKIAAALDCSVNITFVDDTTGESI